MPKHLAYYMLSFSEKWNKILKCIYVYGAMYVFSSTTVWCIQDNRMHALFFWTSVSQNIGVFVWVCVCVCMNAKDPVTLSTFSNTDTKTEWIVSRDLFHSHTHTHQYTHTDTRKQKHKNTYILLGNKESQ